MDSTGEFVRLPPRARADGRRRVARTGPRRVRGHGCHPGPASRGRHRTGEPRRGTRPAPPCDARVQRSRPHEFAWLRPPEERPGFGPSPTMGQPAVLGPSPAMGQPLVPPPVSGAPVSASPVSASPVSPSPVMAPPTLAPPIGRPGRPPMADSPAAGPFQAGPRAGSPLGSPPREARRPPQPWRLRRWATRSRRRASPRRRQRPRRLSRPCSTSPTSSRGTAVRSWWSSRR